MRMKLLILGCCGLLLSLLTVNRQVLVLNLFNTYSVQMKNGKPEVQYQGKPLMSPVTLANGAQIAPDAVLVDTRGTSKLLKSDECVSEAGEILEIKDLLQTE